MMKELYRIQTAETSLNVVQGKIDSVRRKQIVKSGCRVYEDGFIGIAGTLGEATEDTWQQAVENLERKVPYPYAPEQNCRRHEDRAEEILDASVFIQRTEALLDRLRAAFPRIVLSNKVNMTEYRVSLTNTAGLDYQFRDHFYTVVLLAKDIDSSSVYDTVVEYESRIFDVDAVFADAAELLQAHQIPAVLPDDSALPVIVMPNLFTEPLDQALNGQLFHRKASLLSGKQGQQVFSPDLTLRVDKTAENFCVPFFDAEGTVLPGDQITLIENGVLLRPYTDKKTAAEFGGSRTGAGSGSYDDLPQLDSPVESFSHSGKTLRELLQGRDAAFVVMASGGDCTADGSMATPVQTAYLYRDGTLLGRLPEFSIRGSLFDLLGKNYLGYSKDRPFFGWRWLAVLAEVVP